MEQKEFIEYIKSLGFRLKEFLEYTYEYKGFTLNLWEDNYFIFNSSEKMNNYTDFNNLRPLLKLIRSHKLKQLLK